MNTKHLILIGAFVTLASAAWGIPGSDEQADDSSSPRHEHDGRTRHCVEDLNALQIFYRETGAPGKPRLVLSDELRAYAHWILAAHAVIAEDPGPIEPLTSDSRPRRHVIK